ncbi:hypothetical protein KBC89_01690 [Candidatus Woesebacteria bacterium]|nr:hypothetical protein [Candidatus Woesebacteria bacterium]
MSKVTAPLVIYIDRKKIDLFIGDQNKVVSWQLPETIFHHLEIQDAQAFRKLFEDAIAAYKIQPTKIIIIFSHNIVFGIELPTEESELTKREAILTQFRDQVPFASPFVKEIKLEKKDMAVALNRDLFELLVAQLKGLGFDVSTLVTTQVVPFTIPESGMTTTEALEVIKNWAHLEANDFLEPEHKGGFITTREEQDPKEKNRIFLLIGAFVVLMLVLGGVIVFALQQNKKDQEATAAARALLEKQTQEQQVVPTPITVEKPLVSDQAIVASGSAVAVSPELIAERSKYSVVIYEPSSSVIKSVEISNRLQAAGFAKPNIIANSTLGDDDLLVTTDTDVTAATRQALKTLLIDFDAQTSVKTVEGSEANIVIILPI